MIYPYQTQVYDGIRRAMAVHQYAKQLEIPIKPRTHTLVIGPTGTGKTHLANAALAESNWGVYHVNCSMWMVIGSRGESHTFQEIIAWVAREPGDRPLAIVLDEIDKVGLTTTDWYRNVVSEMLSLLDRHLLPGVYDLNGVSGAEVERRFKNLFIVGCGAFQSLEDSPQSGMGFNPENKTARSLNKLSELLPRELANRFSDKVLRLNKLRVEDYREIAKSMYRSSGEEIRPIIKQIAEARVGMAVENDHGARFAEVLAAEVIDSLLDENTLGTWVDKSRAVDQAYEDLWDMRIDGY